VSAFGVVEPVDARAALDEPEVGELVEQLVIGRERKPVFADEFEDPQRQLGISTPG
jgi:hypothetical protein